MKHVDIVVDRKRHARIKYQLELLNLTLVDVSEQIGVGPSAVSSVSLGKSRSLKIERHLAKTLGQEVEELFPERYAKNCIDTEVNR
ncbi:MAG: helix-turn-helix domain-containing protein [Litoreibacter sp.]